LIQVPSAVSAAASAGLQIILPMSAAAAAGPEHLSKPAAAAATVGPEHCTPPAMAALVAPGVAARAALVAPGVAARLPNLVAARLLGIVAPVIVARPWASP